MPRIAKREKIEGIICSKNTIKHNEQIIYQASPNTQIKHYLIKDKKGNEKAIICKIPFGAHSHYILIEPNKNNKPIIRSSLLCCLNNIEGLLLKEKKQYCQKIGG